MPPRATSLFIEHRSCERRDVITPAPSSSFRLGPEDAALTAREFKPYFDHLDLLNPPNRDVRIKLMIDGAPLGPFRATTLPPLHVNRN